MEDGLVQWGYAKPDKICVQSFYYRIKDGVVVTVLSPNPREERTPYLITPDGKLKLSYSYYDTLWARTTEQAFFTDGDRWEPDPEMSRPDYMAYLRQPPNVYQRGEAQSNGVPPQFVINTDALWKVWKYSRGTFCSFHLKDFKSILERGVIPSRTCNEDRTLLMYLAGDGYTEAVRLLLDNGFDVNAVDLHGETAVDHAIYRHRKETLQLLFGRGGRSGREIE